MSTATATTVTATAATTVAINQPFWSINPTTGRCIYYLSIDQLPIDVDLNIVKNRIIERCYMPSYKATKYVHVTVELNSIPLNDEFKKVDVTIYDNCPIVTSFINQLNDLYNNKKEKMFVQPSTNAKCSFIIGYKHALDAKNPTILPKLDVSSVLTTTSTTEFVKPTGKQINTYLYIEKTHCDTYKATELRNYIAKQVCFCGNCKVTNFIDYCCNVRVNFIPNTLQVVQENTINGLKQQKYIDAYIAIGTYPEYKDKYGLFNKISSDPSIKTRFEGIGGFPVHIKFPSKSAISRAKRANRKMHKEMLNDNYANSADNNDFVEVSLDDAPVDSSNESKIEE